MTIQTESSQFRFIPVRDLQVSPLNVRKTGAEAGIEELASLILAEGVLQNLNVHSLEDNGKPPFGVVAGGRRLRALQQLIKKKKLKADHPVPCMVVKLDRALQISLAENSGREPMHPADEFEAFRQLIDQGATLEDVAARFGVTPLVVQRRLKLSNVSPSLIDAYRHGKLCLDQLMAFAVSDDHARQVEVWKSLKSWETDSEHIRQRLTEGELSLRDPVAKYVGIAAYEKAGGIVRRDLFGEDADVFLEAALVHQLASAKLEKQAAKLRAEGLPWVDVHPKLDYATRSTYGHVAYTSRKPTAEEADAIAALEAKLEALERNEEDASGDAEEAGEQSWSETSDALEALRERLHVPDPEQQALAGAVISVGRDGRLEIVRDLLKPSDAAKLARAGRPRTNGATEADATASVHSAALVRRLTAHRTLALQAEVADRPDVALIAITHRLLLWSFYPFEFVDSPVRLQKQTLVIAQHEQDLEGSKAQQALKERREALQVELPKSGAELLGWLAAKPQAEILSLLALSVAETIDGVKSEEGASDLDPLASLACLDMRRWWQPTAANYFASVARARILEVVTAVKSAQEAGSLAHITKARAAQEAEKLLADSGWLPEVLRSLV